MEHLQSFQSLASELERYVEKVKTDEVAHFICKTNNQVTLPLVVETLERSTSRIDQLAHHEFVPERQIQHESESPPVAPQPRNDSTAKGDLTAPTKDVERSGFTTTRLPLVSEVWNAKDPANYHVQIKVGAKDVPFYVTVDTGSSILWLQSIIKEGEPFADQNAYVPPDGANAQGDADDTEIAYGDLKKIHMKLFEDTVNLGGLIAAPQAVGAVTKIDMGKAMRESRANGLMGLGTRLDGSAEARRRNLAQTLFADGRIKFPSFSMVGPRNDPVAARKLIAEKTWQQPRGEFVIGALPTEVQDEGGITWCRLGSKDPYRWVIRLNEVVVNDEVLFEDQYAFIDTGTSYVLTSGSNFTQVKEKLQGKPFVIDGKSSNQLFVYAEKSLKSIKFNFGQKSDDGPGQDRSFPLTNEDLSLGRDPDQRCVSSIATSSTFPFEDNYWVLGGIFIDNFVVTFDFAENDRKIGFATLGSTLDLAPTEGNKA